jgi:plasmid replication initiation protein
MANSSPVIIKNNFLIETSGKIDFTGMKLFNSLFHHAYNELQDKEIHTISSNEIKKYLNYTDKINFKHIKKSLSSLMNFIIQWDIFDESTGEETSGGSTLLASYEFKKGLCEFAFSPHLRKRLLADTLYTKINLKLQNQFSGKYSLRMYELAKEFFRQKEEFGETRFIPLDKFKRFLGIPEDKIIAFKVLKRDVLTPTVIEINELSDVNIDLSFEKQGTKVIGIKLKIKKNPNDKKRKKFEEEKLLIQKNSKPFDPSNVDELNQHNPLKTSILSLGINEKQIDEWLGQYPTKYIQSKYNITIEQLKLGKIKTSPSGFLVRAVEDDYGSKVGMDEMIQKEALEARKLNPETYLVDPFDFNSYEDFEEKIKELKTQYYNPFFIQSEVEAASRGKWKG